jgi:endoglucanase
MKKITLFLTLIVSSIGFAQNLVTNGDFQTGVATPWYNNAANVVDLGDGNYVNQANVLVAGDAYVVNLSQNIVLDNGKKYKLSFDAFTDETTGSRTMIVGLGQNDGPWTALTQTTTLTSTLQTFEYEFIINYGDAVGDRVLFDMGADTGFVFIDNVSVVEVEDSCTNGIQDGDETGVDCGGSCAPCIEGPTVAAPTPPARPADDVVSIYSDAYANIDVNLFDAGWCGAAGSIEVQIAGNNTLRKNTGVICHGIDFQEHRLDLSDFTHIHFDFYIADTDLVGDVFNLKLVDFAGTNSFVTELHVNINGGSTPQLVANQWVSVDVPITALGGVIAGDLTRSDIAQVGITTPFVDNVWYDNIYLHKNTVLDVVDNKMIAAKLFPNPATNILNVQANSRIENVSIFNVVGQEVVSMKSDDELVKVDVSSLNTGIYVVKTTIEGKTSTSKFIKE